MLWYFAKPPVILRIAVTHHDLRTDLKGMRGPRRGSGVGRALSVGG
jgi:hypothetical protein